MRSLDELLAAKEKIYIRNNSEPIGKFIIVFPSRTGKNFEFLVPVTDIPLCLSDAIPMKDLESAPDLRDFIVKGIVELVDPKEAEKILSTTEAREEMRAMQVSEFSKHSKFSSQKVSILKRINVDEAKRLEKELSVQDTSSDSGIITPWVKDVIMRVDTNDMSVKDGVRQFKIKKKELSENDLQYTITNAKGQILAYAQTLLAERQSSQDDIVDEDEPMTAEERAAEEEALKKQQVHKGN